MLKIIFQNGKVMEVMLAGFNSNAVKTTFRHLHYFKMTLFYLEVLQKSPPISLPLSHT